MIVREGNAVVAIRVEAASYESDTSDGLQSHIDSAPKDVSNSVVDCLDVYSSALFIPRPKGDGKRSAILSAAIDLIATQGLSAPAMGMAKEAGIPNGSLFTYFPTKLVLLAFHSPVHVCPDSHSLLEEITSPFALRRRTRDCWSTP